MKKIMILITAISIMMVSCEKEEIQPDCNCGLVYNSVQLKNTSTPLKHIYVRHLCSEKILVAMVVNHPDLYKVGDIWCDKTGTEW